MPLLMALVLLGSAFPPSGSAEPGSGAESTSHANREARPGEYIVVFDEDETRPSLRAEAHMRAGAELVEEAAASGRRYQLVEMGEETELGEAVEAYADTPGVEWVQPNYVYRRAAAPVPSDPLFGHQWALRNTGQSGGTSGADIRALEAWSVTTGTAGPIIAVIDDGVHHGHPDLAANVMVAQGWNFAKGATNTGNTLPDSGDTHGTQVAGIAAALGDNGIGIAGVSWNARILPIKIFWSEKVDGSIVSMTDSITAAKAITYASDQGARIINASWGGYAPRSDAEQDTVLMTAIAESKALLVAASGNGDNTGAGVDMNGAHGWAFYPASFDLPNVISVAASESTDRVTSFSNYGAASVDLAAPGLEVTSTAFSSSYAAGNGTSMATPHVSGAAALALSVNPSLTTAQLRRVLLSSIDQLGTDRGKVATQGRLNLAKVVQLASAPPVSSVGRMAGADRYQAAVDIARRSNPGWEGVTDIVLACGEDRAAADPLAASGLVWALDGAPILLTTSGFLPRSLASALREIAKANPGGVRVHAVGGTVPIPDARLAEIRAIAPGVITTPKRVAGRDRYSTAHDIVKRMRELRPGEMPRRALVANGADFPKFFDALALSPVTAATGAPVLLVSEKTVPDATVSALRLVNPTEVIIGGGTATVSSDVQKRLSALTGNTRRWSGANRYETAAAIAHNASARAWLGADRVAIAAGLPDALAGGAMMGHRGGGLLLTEKDRVHPASRRWLNARTGVVDQAWVLGGTAVVGSGTEPAVRSLIR